MASPRFLARVDAEGRLCPAQPERWKRRAGRDVWLSSHDAPSVGIRSSKSNSYLWGVCYATLSKETGNDPDSIHYGLKREALRIGILEPEYIVVGDRLIEGDPTTVTDVDTFSRYVEWVRHFAEHDLGVHIPEPNE